jgi:hypothetical protein
MALWVPEEGTAHGTEEDGEAVREKAQAGEHKAAQG